MIRPRLQCSLRDPGGGLGLGWQTTLVHTLRGNWSALFYLDLQAGSNDLPSRITCFPTISVRRAILSDDRATLSSPATISRYIGGPSCGTPHSCTPPGLRWHWAAHTLTRASCRDPCIPRPGSLLARTLYSALRPKYRLGMGFSARPGTLAGLERGAIDTADGAHGRLCPSAGTGATGVPVARDGGLCRKPTVLARVPVRRSKKDRQGWH